MSSFLGDVLGGLNTLVLVELRLWCGMTSGVCRVRELVWLHVQRSSLVLLLLVWMV